MIKARKGDLIILGLSDENMKRLADNQPIKFKLKDLNVDVDSVNDYEVLIFNGRNEETMALTLNEMAKPQN